MAGGAGYYSVHNNQVGDITFLNADGNQVNMLPGATQSVYLTASVWASLVALVGASNVVASVLNPTYEYGVLGVSPVATPTDWIVIQGSATKTVNITKMRLSAICTATGGPLVTQVVRRLSTGGTQGSAVLTAVTPALTDISIAAATGVVSTVGTANYTTVQTINGVIAVGRVWVGLNTAGAGGDAQALKFSWGDNGGNPIKLRGTTDYVCVNFNGATLLAGTAIDFTMETYEDNS